MNADQRAAMAAPARFRSPSIFIWVVIISFAAFFIQGFASADIRSERLLQGIGNLGSFFAQSVPPDTNRLGPIFGQC